MSNRLSFKFCAGVDPSGHVVVPVAGQLQCPHCNEPHENPNDGYFNTWNPTHVRALAAMNASRVCEGCGKSSPVTAESLS